MKVINVDKNGNVIDDLTKVILPPGLQEALNNAVSKEEKEWITKKNR